jgi:hypothetical protein
MPYLYLSHILILISRNAVATGPVRFGLLAVFLVKSRAVHSALVSPLVKIMYETTGLCSMNHVSGCLLNSSLPLGVLMRLIYRLGGEECQDLPDIEEAMSHESTND